MQGREDTDETKEREGRQAPGKWEREMARLREREREPKDGQRQKSSGTKVMATLCYLQKGTDKFRMDYYCESAFLLHAHLVY